MKSYKAHIKYFLLLNIIVTMLTACAGRPRFELQEDIRPEIISHALSMRDTPYLLGGNTPGGFDCSGLVQYSYRKAGVELPRTSFQQYKASSPVYMERLKPGDLVFFRTNHQRVSHVGLYLGRQQFIHAPGQGRHVTIENLKSAYWHKRIAGAGTFFH